jgi:hypothetical protein
VRKEEYSNTVRGKEIKQRSVENKRGGLSILYLTDLNNTLQ